MTQSMIVHYSPCLAIHTSHLPPPLTKLFQPNHTKPFQIIPIHTNPCQTIPNLQSLSPLSNTAISIHNATLLSYHFQKIATVSHFRLVWIHSSLKLRNLGKIRSEMFKWKCYVDTEKMSVLKITSHSWTFILEIVSFHIGRK